MALATTMHTAKVSQTITTLLDGSNTIPLKMCLSYASSKDLNYTSKRRFTTTPRASIKEFFPPPANAPNIKITPPAWHHPVYVD